MPRGYIPISRADEDNQGTQSLSPWLQNVADQLAKQQETAVEKSRTRANMISQVNNIMKNPPRYATVEDAVQDLRERTGLNEYLRRIEAKEKLNKKASKNIQKRDEEELLTDEYANKLANFINGSSKDLKKKVTAQSNSQVPFPPVLTKYPEHAVKTITQFIKNNINSHHGLSSSVPQLQYDVLHILGHSLKLRSEDIMSHEFAKWVSEMITIHSPTTHTQEFDYNIGLMDTTDSDDDSNDNFWKGIEGFAG